MTYRQISVEPLTPTVGAEISNVDLRGPLDDETLTEIRCALLGHGVVFFRDQPIDPRAPCRLRETLRRASHPSRLARASTTVRS